MTPKRAGGGEPAENYVEALRKGVPFRNEDGVLEYPTMSSRPQPNFVLDPLHRFLLIGSVVTTVAYTLFMWIRIPGMPDEVPMHFAADGSVNRYGSPMEMIGLSILMTVTILGCAVLARFPRVYNYGFGKITEDNIQAHYKNGVQMMVWTVFSMTVLYIIALGGTAGDWATSPAIWLAMVLMLGSMGYFILRMSKL